MEKIEEKNLPTAHKISCLWGVLNGPTTLRPHYHAAVFNYWPNDAKFYKCNKIGDKLYTSEELNKIWGNGYVIIGNLTYESAAYIARYVYKKAYGGEKLPLKQNKTPEYTTCSKNPGLAKEWFTNPKKWELLLRNNGVLIPTKNGLKLKPIPQYLRNKWKEWDHANYYAWQEQQHQKQIQNQKNILSKTDKNFGWYKKQKAEQKLKSLKRLDKHRNNI